MSYWAAARFCNWLHNGQGSGDTESGAYANIDNPYSFSRQPGAKYFIPTENEWYKAAYHMNNGATGDYWDYPTGTDAVPNNGDPEGDTGNTANFSDGGGYTAGSPYYVTPVGRFGESESPYVTFDQAGNLYEWNEDAVFNNQNNRYVRGGSWSNPVSVLPASYHNAATNAGSRASNVGFRVASVVPEPGSLVMLAGIAVMSLAYRRRRKA